MSTKDLSKLILMGPPYRWTRPDCHCYYSDNYYVREVLGHRIDAYFALSHSAVRLEEFWQDARNREAARVSLGPKLREAVWLACVSELDKRRGQAESFRHNAVRCRATYEPLHPELFLQHDATLSRDPNLSSDSLPNLLQGLSPSDIFEQEFLEAWTDAVDGRAPSALARVHNECYQVRIFRKSFVRMLQEEIRHFKSKGLSHQWPNTMNRDGLILNEIGLGPFMDRLIALYLTPLAKKMYPQYLDKGFEAHHSFVVAYSQATDRGLGVHDDNSEVTINISLSDDYEGASLALYHHARCPHPQQEAKEEFRWRVGSGTMLMHPGEMLHEVLPLTGGHRMGLILWLKSNRYRAEHGCPLCGKTDDLLFETNEAGVEVPRFLAGSSAASRL